MPKPQYPRAIKSSNVLSKTPKYSVYNHVSSKFSNLSKHQIFGIFAFAWFIFCWSTKLIDQLIIAALMEIKKTENKIDKISI